MWMLYKYTVFTYFTPSLSLETICFDLYHQDCLKMKNIQTVVGINNFDLLELFLDKLW